MKLPYNSNNANIASSQSKSGADTKSKAFRAFVFSSVCVLFAVVLNVSSSLLASTLHIPLYMDSIATIALSSLCGFFPSIIGAFLTSLSMTLLGKLRLIFCVCQILTASGASLVFYLFRRQSELNPDTEKSTEFPLDSFMYAGILSAFSNGILGSVFAAFMGYNLTAIEKGLLFLTKNIFASNLAGGFILNLIDKSFAAFVSYLIYRFVRIFFFRVVRHDVPSGFSQFRLSPTLLRSGGFDISQPPSLRNTPFRRAATIPTTSKHRRRAFLFRLKPEYIFFIVSIITLMSGIFLKHQINKTFSEEYEKHIDTFFTGGGQDKFPKSARIRRADKLRF